MIKNCILLEVFNNDFVKQNKLTYNESFRIFDLMLDECISIGLMPFNDPLGGIDKDIKMAKILNNIHD